MSSNRKIKMSESDFIELVTELANNENCCIKTNEVTICEEIGCENCWAEMLSKYIEV